MQFSAESVLPYSMSAYDISDPASSSNISFDQYNCIDGNRVVPFVEPERVFIVMAKVFTS